MLDLLLGGVLLDGVVVVCGGVPELDCDDVGAVCWAERTGAAAMIPQSSKTDGKRMQKGYRKWGKMRSLYVVGLV